MDFNITVGWWAVPATITVLAYAWHWWMHKDEQPSGDYGAIGAAFGQLLTGLAAAVVTLVSWLTWAVIF